MYIRTSTVHLPFSVPQASQQLCLSAAASAEQTPVPQVWLHIPTHE